MTDVIKDSGNRLFENELIASASTGRLHGYQALDIQGTNRDVDVGTEDLWIVGGVRVYPTVAAVVGIDGGANDTAAGTGIRRVRIFGLDANWDYQSEIVTLNGVTVVNTVNTYIRVNGLQGLETGTLEGAGADIDATLGGNIQARILAGRGSSQLSHYSVARNKNGYIFRVFASGSNSTDDLTAELEVRALDVAGDESFETGPWTTYRDVLIDNRHIAAEIGGAFTPVRGPSDIRMQATSVSNNERVSGGYTLLLEDVDRASIGMGNPLEDGRSTTLNRGET